MKRLKTCCAALASAAMLCVLGTVPASALTDTAVDETGANTVTLANQEASSTDAMPGNPNAELPDKVSNKIPDTATVVSENLAVTEDGKVKDIETGKTVTDPELVGTKDKQPDPLAKTDGDSFIPVEASEVKQAVADSAKAETSASKTEAKVRLASLGNGEYGAYWGTYNGSPAFFDAGGNVFVKNAKGVVDVSEWQGQIDWAQAKANGVQGAIIRVTYGWGNGYDKYALYNISECKRLGIPFGIYMYSYAYDQAGAAGEGEYTAQLLQNAGVSPSDLSYPVYYDLEKWTWVGYAPPTSPAVYDTIVNAWYGKMKAAGYNNLGVYSYTTYLNGPLNSANIHSKTSWVAQYAGYMGFADWSTKIRGWQYTSGGSVPGISGSADLNAFGTTDGSSSGGNGNNSGSTAIDVTKLNAVTVRDGNYYINSWAKDSMGVDIPDASSANGVQAQLYSYGSDRSQRFHFARQSDGSYVITAVGSGKALEVSGGKATAGAAVQQNTANGSKAQRWFIRDAGSDAAGAAYYLQSALGNVVLDAYNGGTSNGTPLQVWTPNGTAAQGYLLASTSVNVYVGKNVIIASAKNTDVVVDVPKESKDNFTQLQLYKNNGSAAQIFKFIKTGNGTYEIRNVNSNKNIDVYNGMTGNGAAVQQYQSNGTPAQHWLVRDAGNGAVTLINSKSNKALDVPSGNAVSRTQLQVYTQIGTAGQQWHIVQQGNAVVEKVEMYRLYNHHTGEHFYTRNSAERDNLRSAGWTYEGIGWIAPASSNTPVYRLYNPNASDHHYTASVSERDNLLAHGWRDEGIGWYSADANQTPVYRQYNPNAVSGTHNYTVSKDEVADLLARGWRDEGIGWYAI
ncbi:RICIN domain-containing protein [Bifidobacterium sp. SO4]|uniref:RICIN domain-containing protein n=1 Tax=Bifidobacterium sp. SO4 TaxID=2809030 RepID=UPI001BDC2572|nr:RICIN domain-containing protein [Bifidobacterium sp. SO4]MBT1171750.1 RICIN domain-containing protein [Bifidobacterium sp. SO4]